MGQDLIREGKLDRQAAAGALKQFLEEIVRISGLELKINVRAIDPSAPDASGDAEVIADLDGRDKEILLERNGEVLKAFEHLAFRALRLEPTYHEKIHLDSGGYRALRFEELRMTARVAAERVQSSHQPFRLNPMSSRERRIVHLALKEMPGFIHFYAVSERRGTISAHLRKSRVVYLDDGDAAFLVKTSDRKTREPQNGLHFGQALGSVGILIGNGVGVVAMLEGGQVRPFAEIKADFVDAVGRVDETIPMPERWRKGERAKRFHLKLEERSELFDAFESSAMRVESCGEVEKGGCEARAIPRRIADAQSFATCGGEKKKWRQPPNDSDGSLRRYRRADLFPKIRDAQRSEREYGPSDDRAILQTFGLAVNPGEDLGT